VNVPRFFKDKQGKRVLYQHPNLLLWLWILTQAISILIFRRDNQSLNSLSDLLLFTWSYMEIRFGVSPFRRALGGVVALFIIVGLFVW